MFYNVWNQIHGQKLKTNDHRDNECLNQIKISCAEFSKQTIDYEFKIINQNVKVPAKQNLDLSELGKSHLTNLWWTIQPLTN